MIRLTLQIALVFSNLVNILTNSFKMIELNKTYKFYKNLLTIN